MNIELNYGKSGYTLCLPEDLDVTVIRKRPMRSLTDPELTLSKVLNAPLAAAELDKVITKDTNVCIVICDDTRPVPNGLILPILLKKIVAAGGRLENISILVATGLHEPLKEEALRRTVGNDEVFRQVRVVNHDAKDKHTHEMLGSTSSGIPTCLDKRFTGADVRVIVGLVEPHFMAGYSGGRKLIAPGIASAETISYLHAYSILSQPKATNCILDGNPLHAAQLEIAAKFENCYAVNVVLDEQRNVCFLNFGDLVQSHAEAVKYFREYGEIELERQYRTVITTAAGQPLDNTYYQTIKGMVGAKQALMKNGRMFVASRCEKGFGSMMFRDAQRRLVKLGAAAFLSELQKKIKADIDEWQTQLLADVMLRGSFGLYSEGLSEEDRKLTGGEDLPNLESAILSWVKECGDKRVAVIPEGPYVIPLYHSHESNSK